MRVLTSMCIGLLAATVNPPADLKSAEQALGRAERCFEEDGAGSNTDDLAYIAQRRAQIATAVANRQLAELQKVRYAKEREELVAQGVIPHTMSATGFGESRPIATNTTIEGRANNRRVEIVLAPVPVAQP